MPKRVLLLSFFYPPDLSAGSFRAVALVEAFQREADHDVQIDVLTAQPNRYISHVVDAVSREDASGVCIRRISLPGVRKGFVGQAVSFWRYARKVCRLTADQDYDLVVATSSRLMTAVLGAWVAYRRNARLYLDMRDIFVENLNVLFPRFVALPLQFFFGALERWAIGRADRVNLVSRGFLGYFQPRYPSRRFSVLPNGVDDSFMGIEPVASAPSSGRPIKIMYAGNFGDGQGMHLILPAMARRLRGRASFLLIGGGARLQLLRDALQAEDVDNVELRPPVAREQLLDLYRQADVLFLHLNDFSAFRRVLPSKLYEYAATGKPILAGVAGHAAEFMEKEIRNFALFPPGDVGAAVAGLESLALTWTDRSAFVKHYARTGIMDEMVQEMLQLMEPE